MATATVETVRNAPDRTSRHRGRVLVAVAIAATAAVVVPVAIGGGTSFASWAATPEPLSGSTATAAATTCQAAFGIDDQRARAVISEKRGGWTYVLIESPTVEASCLMPEDRIGVSNDAVRKNGFLGTLDGDPPEAPTPVRDGIIETMSMGGTVPVPGRLPFTTTDGWISWVSGYVGTDVTGVTVHPPVGPDVEATVSRGRFSAWWPAGEAQGHRRGMGGGWAYTVTLADGTSRPDA